MSSVAFRTCRGEQVETVNDDDGQRRNGTTSPNGSPVHQTDRRRPAADINLIEQTLLVHLYRKKQQPQKQPSDVRPADDDRLGGSNRRLGVVRRGPRKIPTYIALEPMFYGKEELPEDNRRYSERPQSRVQSALSSTSSSTSRQPTTPGAADIQLDDVIYGVIKKLDPTDDISKIDDMIIDASGRETPIRRGHRFPVLRRRSPDADDPDRRCPNQSSTPGRNGRSLTDDEEKTIRRQMVRRPVNVEHQLKRDGVAVAVIRRRTTAVVGPPMDHPGEGPRRARPGCCPPKVERREDLPPVWQSVRRPGRPLRPGEWKVEKVWMRPAHRFNISPLVMARQDVVL